MDVYYASHKYTKSNSKEWTQEFAIIKRDGPFIIQFIVEATFDKDDKITYMDMVSLRMIVQPSDFSCEVSLLDSLVLRDGEDIVQVNNLESQDYLIQNTTTFGSIRKIQSQRGKQVLVVESRLTTKILGAGYRFRPMQASALINTIRVLLNSVDEDGMPNQPDLRLMGLTKMHLDPKEIDRFIA
jgi:hypothetical protein